MDFPSLLILTQAVASVGNNSSYMVAWDIDNLASSSSGLLWFASHSYALRKYTFFFLSLRKDTTTQYSATPKSGWTQNSQV